METSVGNHNGELFSRTLLQSLPGAIAAASARGKILFVNSAFCNLVGWSEEELIGQTVPFSYWPPEDQAEILDCFRREHSDPASMPTMIGVRRFRRKDEERFLVRIMLAPLIDHKGDVIGSIASVEDLRDIGEFQSVLDDRERFFEHIARSVPSYIYVFDVANLVNVYTNRHLARSLGYHPDRLKDLGDQLLPHVMHPDDLARIPELFSRWESTRDGEILETEYRLKPAKGDFRWFQSRDAVFQRDQNGKVIQIIGAAQDITSRKKAEDAQREAERHLRESERRYRVLADHATDMIARLDPSGTYIDVSPACGRTIGCAPNELAGRSEYELVHPADRDAVFAFHRDIVGGKNPRTLAYRIRRKDSEYVWLETHAQPILDPESGEVVELLAVSRDVTDRTMAAEALRRSEQQFRALVERSRDGIALLHAHGVVRYLSPAAVDILGYTQPELAEIDARTLIFPEDYQEFVKDGRAALRVPDGTHSSQVRIRDRAGKVRHIELVVTNHLNDDYIRAFVVNFRDVTDRIELEEHLRQAQKMEAVGQLAGGIAHDFNNILTAIIGNVALAQDAAAQGQSPRQTLVAIDKAARRAAELTSRLLGYSRRTTLHVRSTDLNRLIEELLNLLRPTIDPRIVFASELDPAVWPARADANQFSQVLTNLCLNARDAMPRGGRLTIRTSNCVIDDSYVKTHVFAHPGSYVRVCVDDTGTGMTAEVRSRVFEPFFTTKPTGAGTGLGLAMVYGIAKSHGGWVDCSSEPGCGTSMELYLPRSLEPVEEFSTGERLSAIPSQGGETILLVDDEPSIRTLGRFTLEQNGYRVLLAEDGLEAVETFREIADQIDLIILDLTMPNMSGQDAFRHMREIAPNVPVLFSSGYTSDHLGNLDAGVGFINKPYRPEQLLDAVRSHILSRSSSRFGE